MNDVSKCLNYIFFTSNPLALSLSMLHFNFTQDYIKLFSNFRKSSTQSHKLTAVSMRLFFIYLSSFLHGWNERVPYARFKVSIQSIYSPIYPHFAHDDSVLFVQKRFIWCYIHKCLVSFSSHVCKQNGQRDRSMEIYI